MPSGTVNNPWSQIGAPQPNPVTNTDTDLLAPQLSAAEVSRVRSLALGAGTEQIFVQPDATGTWTNRPSALVITIPTWANFLRLGMSTGGGSGGSGRQGAAGTARSGGAGGQAGVVRTFTIALRNSSGALLAETGSLTVGVSTAGGASAAAADTSGNAGAFGPSTTFVFNGVSYIATAGGSAAPGGTTIPVNSGTNANSQFEVSAAQATSVTANLNLIYPNGICSPGAPGGSISTADALLTVAGIIIPQAGGGPLSSTTPSGDGLGYQRGETMAAVGGMGGLSSSSAAAGAGGNGIWGSGGGGGGASLNSFASGAGGRGGAGWAILQWGV